MGDNYETDKNGVDFLLGILETGISTREMYR